MPSPWTPTSALGYAVYAAGFLYNPDQDIIYSRMDALQRSFGYAFGYDAAALGMNADLDCEPIFFDYDGKHWMIELWKGQYGLETDAKSGFTPGRSARRAWATACSTPRSGNALATACPPTTSSTTAPPMPTGSRSQRHSIATAR